MGIKSPFQDRNNTILLYVIAGMSLKDVGLRFGVTRSGAQQIISKKIKRVYPNVYENIKLDSGLISIVKLREQYRNKLIFEEKTV